MKYTLREKLRFALGVHGQMPDGRYCYGNFDRFSFKTAKRLYTFMFYVGNPVLNFLIGYKRI